MRPAHLSWRRGIQGVGRVRDAEWRRVRAGEREAGERRERVIGRSGTLRCELGRERKEKPTRREKDPHSSESAITCHAAQTLRRPRADNPGQPQLRIPSSPSKSVLIPRAIAASCVEHQGKYTQPRGNLDYAVTRQPSRASPPKTSRCPRGAPPPPPPPHPTLLPQNDSPPTPTNHSGPTSP